MEESKDRAIEAFWILNGIGGDLIGATRAFEYFETPRFKGVATDQVLRIFNRIADSFLFVTLAKWIEFYDRYNVLIPPGPKAICKSLRNELVRRGVKEFRNQVVGHIWSKKHSRPLLANEIEDLDKKITKGDMREFLRWINDPKNNHLGKTIVGTIEFVRDSIQKKWALSEQELLLTNQR